MNSQWFQAVKNGAVRVWRRKAFRAAALAGMLAAVCAAALVFWLSGERMDAPPPDERVVSTFTGGIIAPSEPVRLVFVSARDTSRPPPRGAFVISPDVRGELSWENDWTLLFTPSAPLKGETRYHVTVKPAAFTRNSGADDAALSPFSFEFSTRGPLFDVYFDPVRLEDDKTAVVCGVIVTDDAEDSAHIEKMLRSPQVKLASWRHDGTRHFFSFQPVARSRVEKNITVRLDGKAGSTPVRREWTVTLAPLEHFEVAAVTQSENNVITVNFTSPLRDNQDFQGFIMMAGMELSYQAEQNTVNVFGAQAFKSGSTLYIRDLIDRYGEPLAEPVSFTVAEKWELPALRFPGKGVILPSSQGAALPLETRNLSGVIAEAFEIYGDNIAQFLQVNNLSEQNELVRVGRPVWTKAFDFDWAESDKNRWARRGLDVSELARRYPDSMFYLRLTFRKRHVHYECQTRHADFSGMEFPPDALPPVPGYYGDTSAWDGTQSSYDSDYQYSWYQWRGDPCHPAFYLPRYNQNVIAGKNILVSDLGLLAKRAESGEYLIAATNLKTALPQAGVETALLSFQGRTLASARTGADGTAQIRLPQSSTPAAFLFARAAGNRAFLKLNDSLTLATSHFDVSGEKAAAGLKGFIYGERGVWRPGDTIYLTFLLAGAKNALPEQHPVTFELEDPKGRITETRVFTESTDGFYPITAATRESAPTGNWTARVRVGGAVFYKQIKIETIMPNRLKMELDFGAKKYLDSENTPVTLKAQWLHGAPAPGLKADVAVSFADTAAPFAAYTDYSFRDTSRSVSSHWQTLFSGKLDGAGDAAFTTALSPGRNAPGRLTARLMTRVFEPSGVFSSEQISMEFSPYKRYVGLKLPAGDAARGMLLTDTAHDAQIALLDAEGKPVTGAVELNAALYKMNWRWWWEKGGEEDADWTEALSRTPVMKEKISVTDGKGWFSFRVNQPEWGRYLVIVEDTTGGHAAAAVCYIDWPGWAGRGQSGPSGAAFSLNLSTSKQSYQTGETVAVSFPSNSSASALVVLEKGGEVLRKEWIRCAEGTTRYEFQALPSMAANLYAHITLFQPHLQTANDLPIRLYGIVPVAITDPATVLKPEIRAARVWEPSSSVSFTVKEHAGRAMTYTAVVVDEGLLGLTRFTTPDPHAAFYRKEASFLKSWDLFSDVMGAYSGKLETLLAIGGGDSGELGGGQRPSRFEPVVKYFAPRHLAAGEERTETFTMGEYAGAVRIMVVAASHSAGNAAYGAAEQSVQVKSDLMALVSAPRVLSPNDEAVIPVTVFSFREGKHTVRVSLNLEGNISAAEGTPVSAEAVFDRAGDKTVEFRAKTAALPGRARITARAVSAGLKDAVNTVPLEIRSTAIPVSMARSKLLAAGERWEETFTLPGQAGTNTAAFAFSRLPPLNLENRLAYLIAYPHGCIEQTTSAVFPQLFLDNVMELSPEKRRATQEHVSAGIERIAGFQTYNGGFSYWPGQGEANEWGTNYAGHFLVMARMAGFPVQDTLLDKWIEFQRNKAIGWSGSGAASNEEETRADTLTQAYRLYTLALAGKPDLGSMNRLRERANLPSTAAWRLAAAYWYAGQRDAARVMTASLSQTAAAYRELSGTFGSDLRDRAMILETLLIMGQTDRTKTLVDEITQKLADDNWLSTQELAYALIALLPFTGGNTSAPLEVEYSLGGAAARLSTTLPLAQTDADAITGTTGQAIITNKSPAPVYAQIITRGIPAEGGEPALASGLNLTVQYLYNGAEAEPAAAAAGEDLEVRVTVSNKSPAAVKRIALVHPLPASWEIVNTRLGGSVENAGLSYQDIRDDRILSYFDLERGASRTVSFIVNKAYNGAYFTPAVQCYAMYDESIRAIVPGR